MTRRRDARVAVAAAGVVAVLALAACSGVPTTSGPQVVRTIGSNSDAVALPSDVGPLPPDALVSGFLDAMATDPTHHDAARRYLTAESAQSWTDSTVTVVAEAPQLLGFKSTDQSFAVSYGVVGTVSAGGVYTPTLTGSGTAASLPSQTTTFQLTQEDGRFRIQDPPSGVIIERSEFLSTYRATSLFFPNTEGSRLVPDLRFSALDDQALVSYLLNQLSDGSRPELTGAVNNRVPDSTNQRPGVTIGSPTIVQIPGANALPEDARVQLAAQLAYTLGQSASATSLLLQDGTNVVTVPGVTGPFGIDDFSRFAVVPTGGPNPAATFVRDGAVLDNTARPVSGVLGTGEYALQSATFNRMSGTLVAGTSGPSDAMRLKVGTTSTLTDAGVPTAGALTDPVWAPTAGAVNGDLEVWTASGGTAYQVQVNRETGAPSAVAPVQPLSRTGAVSGSIVSMAFSPEGSRLALVIRAADGSSQVWIGAVVRSGSGVRLEQLVPITPVGVRMNDVGWTSGISLRAVGTADDQPTLYLWDFDVDGSNLEAAQAPGLPISETNPPTAIAVTPSNTQTWVEVGDGAASTVWVQTGTDATWVVPGGGSDPTVGAAPSFSIS